MSGRRQPAQQPTASRDVARLQLLLNLADRGEWKIGITGLENGRWDSQTQTAVSRFVADYNKTIEFPAIGLSATPAALPQLLKALEADVRGKIDTRFQEIEREAQTGSVNPSRIGPVQEKLGHLGHYLGPVNGRYTGDSRRELDAAYAQFKGNTFSTKALIVLDPGHGGGDAGSVAVPSKPEKQVVLDIAHKAKELLVKAGYHPSQIQMTREDDRFIELADRPRTFDRSTSWVSIHADEASNENARGGHAIISRRDELGSAQLARSITKNMADIHGQPVRTQNLAVVREPIVGNTSRTLLEVGFLSNPEIQKTLSDPKTYNQWVTARATELAKGIDEFERSQGRGPSTSPVAMRRTQQTQPHDAKAELVAATHKLYADINKKLQETDPQLTLLNLDHERIKKGEFSELKNDIQKLQTNLNALGAEFRVGKPDGIPGNNTKRALLQFEIKHTKPPEAAAPAPKPAAIGELPPPPHIQPKALPNPDVREI